MTDVPYSFRQSRTIELWKLALRHGLAFTPKNMWLPARLAVAVLRYPASLITLAGRHVTGDLFTTRAGESVVITTDRFGPTIRLVAELPGFLLLGAAGFLVHQGNLTGVLIFFFLGMTILAADLAFLVAPVFRPKLLRALGEQRAALSEEAGHQILAATRPPKAPKGTIGRIAAFARTRPDLLPFYAVAHNDKLAGQYRKEMRAVGSSGWAFKASAE